MSVFWVVLLALLVVGVVLLVLLLTRTLGALRRFQRLASVAVGGTADGAGLLRARVAALKVATRRPSSLGPDRSDP